MTTLTATPSLQTGHAAMVQRIKAASYPPRLKRKKKGLALPQRAPDNSPTQHRLDHAGDMAVKTATPPFPTIIETTHQKFRKQLGPDIVDILDRFHALAHDSESTRGMTASYSGVTIDSSRQDSQHLTERKRLAHEEFRRIWASLGPRIQRLVGELVLELPIGPVPTKNAHMPEIPVVGDRTRSYAAIGRELSGYNDDRRGMGAAVGALRIIGWLIADAMGGRTPIRRTVGA